MRGTFIYSDGRTGNMKSDLLDKLVEAAAKSKKEEGESPLTRVIEKIACQRPRTLRDVFADIVDSLSKPMPEPPLEDEPIEGDAGAAGAAGAAGDPALLGDETEPGIAEDTAPPPYPTPDQGASGIQGLIQEIKAKLSELESQLPGASDQAAPLGEDVDLADTGAPGEPPVEEEAATPLGDDREVDEEGGDGLPEFTVEDVGKEMAKPHAPQAPQPPVPTGVNQSIL